MKINYTGFVGKLCPKFSLSTSIAVIISCCFLLSSYQTYSQASTSCKAHRWNAGDGWRLNTSTNKWEAVVLPSPDLQPKGIVRCASSAETESQLEKFKGIFHAADNPAILSGGGSLGDCFNQNNETFGNTVSKPTEGEDIIWFNFDIRPLAGTYQFQIVTNQTVGWALFYSNKPAPINGVTPGPAYPSTPGGVSGDCSDLTYASVSGHGGCGISGNGWSTITVPSFTQPTNYYLAMWMASPQETTFPNSMNLVYKSRYGCGGATCSLEFLKKELTCTQNGYTVCATYGGSAGKWNIVDNATVKATSYTVTTYKQDGVTVVATASSNNLSTNPLSFILGTLADDGPLFAKICATYADGNPYNISLVPDGSYTLGTNYVPCTSGGSFSGAGITKQSVIATATPSTLILSKNIIASSLHAAVSGGSGNYSYSWQLLNAQGNTSFTNTNTTDPTFTILNNNIPLAPKYDFKVTVTDNVTGCVATATVSVNIEIPPLPCVITGTPPACPSGLQQFTGPTHPDITSYEWKISEYGEVPNGTNPPADGSTIDGSSTSQTVKVKPGSNCKVAYRLTVIATAGLLKASCFIDVAIEDKIAPVLSGQGGPATIECPDKPAFTPPTAKDNCDAAPVLSFVDKTTPGNCDGNYTVTRTWTAKDACGNVSEPVSQTITVKDTKAPYIKCPADVTVSCIGDVPAPDITKVIATDDCGAVTVTFVSDLATGTCPKVITRTYKATDACGNYSICTQKITVDDNIPPYIKCPADVTVSCIGDVPAHDITKVIATDNCGAVTVTFVSDLATGTCPKVITRTYKATDACGNYSICTQKITVDDNIPPYIKCPADVTVSCIGDVPAHDITKVIATDNCGAVTVTFVSDLATGTCPKVITRTYKATDACGNYSICTQKITVDDNIPPYIKCPADVTVSCIGDVPAHDITKVIATDNCGAVTVTFVSDLATGTCPKVITRTYKATDACGNYSICTQKITVDDNIPPYIKCPADVTVSCIGDVPAHDITKVIATDNCGAVTVTFVSDLATGTCPKVITRTYKATDACGNYSICTQKITVDDNIPPYIKCPADITVSCIGDVPAHDITKVIATDNCGAVVVTWISDVPYGTCPKVITRTYKATDACGNYSVCTQKITVDDNIPPYIKCPADITVSCIGNVPAPDITKVIATDNCGAVVVKWISDVPYGTCPKVITRTYKAIDACGNYSVCTQKIIVDDNIPPYIKCPADITVSCIGNVPAPDITKVIATDNCGAVVVKWISDVPYGTCPKVITRTYKAIDACGNYSVCTQKIIVDDNIPPYIKCPADITVSCIGNVPAPDITKVIATDNCGAVVVKWISDVPYGTCPKVITRTYKAIDACGNYSVCTQKIIVDDNIPPYIKCPADITVSCIGNVPAPDITKVIATDNCGAVVVKWISDVPYGTCPKVITRTYKAIDACGNYSVCTQKIIVDDNIPPYIKCPADITVSCIGNVPAPDLTKVIATDNCGAVVVKWISDVPYGTCPKVITRTYKAIDACGNYSVCTQKITVDDNIPPYIKCPADITVSCIGNVPAPDITKVIAADNCGAVVVKWISDVPYGTCPKVITRTYKAIDACGNYSVCTQKITVDDNIPPYIKCPADITVSCIGNVPAPDITKVIATDNCGAVMVKWISDVPYGTCPKVITRTYKAIDACGNYSVCTQKIIVDDKTIPVFTTFPADVTVQCDAIPGFGTPTVNDNCDATPTLTYVDTKIAGTCPQNYKLVRTWTATDDCGNKLWKAQTITVVDTKAPVIVCALNKTLPCGSQVTFTPPTAKDNCDPAPAITILSTVVNGSVTTRTWKATDACGNSTTCSQSITVETCNHIFPTQTACCNYTSNTASPLLKVCYTASGGVVTNAIPGVFFYYTTIKAPASSFTVSVEQTDNNAGFKTFNVQNVQQVRLFSSNCTTIHIAPAISGGNATFTVTGATAGATYVVSVKYDTKSIIGSTTGGILPTVTYTFNSYTTVGGVKTLVPNSTGTLDAKPNCSDNTPLPPSCTMPAITIAKPVPQETVASEVLEATAYPNPAPANGSFNLRIVSPVSGMAVIEYFNASGSKMLESKKLVQAHVPEIVKFNGSNSISGAILYKVSVEGKSVKGFVMRPN